MARLAAVERQSSKLGSPQVLRRAPASGLTWSQPEGCAPGLHLPCGGILSRKCTVNCSAKWTCGTRLTPMRLSAARVTAGPGGACPSSAWSRGEGVLSSSSSSVCVCPCAPTQVKVSAKERLEILKKGLGQSMASVQTGMSSVSSCIGEAATMLSKKVILTQGALHTHSQALFMRCCFSRCSFPCGTAVYRRVTREALG
jgi:hypothetical protein